MKKKFRKKNKKNGVLILILVFVFVFFLSILALKVFEKKVFPSLQEISHTRSMAIANEIINHCVQNVLSEKPLTTEDFITITDSNNTYTANTQQINLFCARLNDEMNRAMQTLPNEKILIPLGSALNTNFFANYGPNIPFTLMPAGAVTSDYETSFTSEGINQINYKVWVNLSFEIQIANPLYQEKIEFTKKIMIIDTIISGKVPDYFYNSGQNKNIY